MSSAPRRPRQVRDAGAGIDWRLAVPAAIASLIGASFALGAWQGQRKTKRLRSRLEATRLPGDTRTYEVEELDGLPAPVQRYFRAALKPGQPMVSAVSIEQRGTLNLSQGGERWRPFVADQRVVTRRPGFDWGASIRAFPGAMVRVHDAYIAGEGILHASMFGLLPLADVRGTPEAARGELIRFLAEAAWYPTALLPSQGVRWQAVDATSANATLRDGATEVTLRFTFDAAGLIETVRAQARGATVGNAIVMTPWEGRWSNYQVCDGMRVPLDGEAAWLQPEGRKPYWRGSNTEMSYEFEPASSQSSNEGR